MLDMNNAFPNDVFAVGRGFPWVHTENAKHPWISKAQPPPVIASSSRFIGLVHSSVMDKMRPQLGAGIACGLGLARTLQATFIGLLYG